VVVAFAFAAADAVGKIRAAAAPQKPTAEFPLGWGAGSSFSYCSQNLPQPLQPSEQQLTLAGAAADSAPLLAGLRLWRSLPRQQNAFKPCHIQGPQAIFTLSNALLSQKLQFLLPTFWKGREKKGGHVLR